MINHEVQPLNLGDEFLPWLKRLQNKISQQVGIEKQKSYARQILERLVSTPLAETEYLVDSVWVLGKDPDRGPADRINFDDSFVFFGKLATFGYLLPPILLIFY